MEEDHDVLDVSAHGCPPTEQEGLRQFQPRYLILFAALHYGETSHVRGAGIGEHLDTPQVQLDYTVKAILLGVLPHVGPILGVHHAPIRDRCYES